MAFTSVNPSFSRVALGERGSAGTTHEEENLRETVRNLLGGSVRLSEQLANGDVNLYSGAPHSTTGLAYAISGRANVVSVNVASKLASFEDPIKAIMPVSVHSSNKIIINRKYVVGGAAGIVPERASARTIAMKEESKEVMLTRYGADLEMNLNLFLEESLAKEELQMKLDAQRQELENTMVRLGYEAIMNEGTNLVTALARMSPAMSALSPADQQDRIDKIFMHSVFGALAKHEFPVQNLLAAAGRAGVYSPSRAGQAVMIMPPCAAMSKFTRESSMKFSVSGLSVADNKVEVPLSNVMVDPISNVKIMVHVPPPSTGPAGAAYPSVNQPTLSRVTSWGTFYPFKDGMYITDFAKRTYSKITTSDFNTCLEACGWTDNSGKYEKTVNGVVYTWDGKDLKKGATNVPNAMPVIVRPKMTCMMQSAVLCTQPGSGELMMAYPQTGVSTSQTLETMRMQLRVYLGAAVFDPNHYIVVPDVAFNGLVSGFSNNFCKGSFFNPDTDGLIAGFMTDNSHVLNVLEDGLFKISCGDMYYGNYYALQGDPRIQGTSPVEEPVEDYPLVLYQGRTWTKASSSPYEERTPNLGHLEHLDDPKYCDTLDGMQKYAPGV